MSINDLPDDFDWMAYVELNPDLKSAGFDEKRSIIHWKNFGYNENRMFKYPDFSNIITKKFVVYTCITSDYDTLKDILHPESNIDYICFTDLNITSNTWQIREIPKFLNELDSTKKARCIKIMPHFFLKEYEMSLWVDGNIQIVGFINQLITLNNFNDHDFYISKHPERICVYKEAEVIKRLNKDSSIIVDNQIDLYEKKGYPKDNGLVQSGVIIRNHNCDDCINFSIQWWNEVLRYSKRDQLSFNYVLWHNKNLKIGLMSPSILSSEYLKFWNHNGNKYSVKKLPENYNDMVNYVNGIESDTIINIPLITFNSNSV